MVLTIAVREPALGFVVKVTVSDVLVAALTMPTAPLLKVTVFSLAVVLKPLPAMVSVARLASALVVLNVTIGVSVATWTVVPLLTPLRVTIAVKGPADGAVENVTVSAVAVAAVTLPTAPLLNATALFPGVVSKPNPLITNVVAVNAKLVVLLVTTGNTLAIWTAVPLLTELVVTTAVRFPRDVGRVVRFTVRVVAVAAVTVPAAPKLKTTVLFADVVSKPNPVIVTAVAFAPRFAVLAVTTGLILAT